MGWSRSRPDKQLEFTANSEAEKQKQTHTHTQKWVAERRRIKKQGLVWLVPQHKGSLICYRLSQLVPGNHKGTGKIPGLRGSWRSGCRERLTCSQKCQPGSTGHPPASCQHVSWFHKGEVWAWENHKGLWIWITSRNDGYFFTAQDVN